MVGVALPAFDSIRRLADKDETERAWQKTLDRLQAISLDLCLLPKSSWKDPATLEFLCAEAGSRGLAAILPLDFRRLPLAGTKEQHLLRLASELCNGLLLELDLNPFLPADDLDPVIEHELMDECRKLGVPLLASGSDPLQGSARLVRNAGKTLDGSTLILHGKAPGDPVSILTSCLAMRLEDRPLICRYRARSKVGETETEAPGKVLTAAIAAAAGIVLLEPLPEGREPDESSWLALETLAHELSELPADLGEARPEQAAIFIPQQQEGPRAIEESRLARGAMKLLQSGLGIASKIVLDSCDAQLSFLFVPAHASLTCADWSLCWSLANKGSEILITCLCIEEEEDRRRLEELGVPLTSKSDSREHTPWLTRRALLQTEGGLLTRPLGLGKFHFTDRAIEVHAAEEASLQLLRRAVRSTDIGLDAGTSDKSGQFRSLVFDAGTLHCNLAGAGCSWQAS